MKETLWRSLSLGFIGVCLCFGIGIGYAIRLTQLQQSPNSTPANQPLPILPPVKEEQIFPEYITIQAVGDVIPGTNFPNYRLPGDRNQLFPKSVRAYLEKGDLLFGNMETTLTKHPTTSKDISRGQVFAFRSPPAYAKLFADVGFDVFNIANNHTLDFGIIGFQDTVKNLNAVGIKTVGEKNQILFLKVNKIPVAMIGFAPYEFNNSINDIKTAQALVQKAKKKANLIIISMHAGAEGTGALNVRNETEYFYGENRGNSVKFARTMIDAGADLVLGHGPHVPRAMELYKGKLIAYSLGNFLGYRTLSTANETGYSMILQVKLNSQGKLVGSKIIPIRMNKQGIPQLDPNFHTVALLRKLIKSDFPKTPIKINQKGEIIVANASK
jgi:poly-gamma-glutamate capsule biosynthesis protein CapA/YwtB (metallophosphatase superfamily)